MIDVGNSVTVTVATEAGLTVIVGVGGELTDSLVAVIVAVPVPTAVTVAGEPLPLTVSTAVLLDTQVILRPVKAFPFASEGVAVSCCVAPTTIGVIGVETATLATGAGVIVISALPVLPSLVAVIVAVPTDTAETTPVLLTVATLGALEVQATLRPVRGCPAASVSAAVA